MNYSLSMCFLGCKWMHIIISYWRQPRCIGGPTLSHIVPHKHSLCPSSGDSGSGQPIWGLGSTGYLVQLGTLRFDWVVVASCYWFAGREQRPMFLGGPDLSHDQNLIAYSHHYKQTSEQGKLDLNYSAKPHLHESNLKSSSDQIPGTPTWNVQLWASTCNWTVHTEAELRPFIVTSCKFLSTATVATHRRTQVLYIHQFPIVWWYVIQAPCGYHNNSVMVWTIICDRTGGISCKKWNNSMSNLIPSIAKNDWVIFSASRNHLLNHKAQGTAWTTFNAAQRVHRKWMCSIWLMEHEAVLPAWWFWCYIEQLFWQLQHFFIKTTCDFFWCLLESPSQ